MIAAPTRDTREQTKLTRHPGKGMCDPSLLLSESRPETTETTAIAPMSPQGLSPTTKISVRRKEGCHGEKQSRRKVV